jgi:PAS domain S-box-containing protein
MGEDKRLLDEGRPQTAAQVAGRASEIAAEAARVAEREEVTAHFAGQVASVASAVAQELGLPALLDVILDQTMRTLGARFAHVYLADTERRTLRLVGSQNLPADLTDRLSCFSFDASRLTARAASTRQAQIVSSIDQLDPALDVTRELLARFGCESMVALPLITRGRLVGVLTFGLEGRHQFTREEGGTLAECAEIFSFGIANAFAYEEERRLHVLFEAVGNATVAIAHEFGLQPVLQNIVDEARRLVDAEFAGLGIVTANDRPFAPWVFSGMTKEQEAAIGRHPRPTATLGIVVSEGRTVRIADVPSHPAFRGFPDHHPAIVSILEVPVRFDGQSIGYLYLANKRGGREFSSQDEQAVELLAAHAGAALQQSRLRDELEAERARLRTIVENAPNGVHFVEAGTEKIIANRRAFELVGQDRVLTAPDYRGQLCTPEGEAIPRGDWPARRVQRGEVVETQEFLLRRPDGRELPLLLGVAPVRRRDGELEGVVVVYEDISPLKELQRLREEWAAIVSHDLQQPLSLITMNLGMLERATASLDQRMLRKGLEQTRKAAKRLSRMINDLADVSRIETRQVTLERHPIDLEALVREVVERQRTIAHDRVINVRVDGPLSLVHVDPIRIEQVLENLLVNAVKYSQPGTAVDVEVRRAVDELRVSVANRGTCIAAEELPKIFDRFYRTAGARAGTVHGLGLGLYIARGLIEAHGGRMWADSGSGKTTFEIALPLT